MSGTSKVKSSLLVVIVSIALLISGCSFSQNSSNNSNDDLTLRVFKMMQKFNEIAQFNNGSTLKLEDDLSISTESFLEKALESICENYALSSESSENISPEQVENALTMDIKSTVEAYEKEGREFYLYKLFAWCGKSAIENLVYVGDPNDEETVMQGLKNLRTKNWQVVAGDIADKENGRTSVYKFKWQQ